MQLHCIPCIHQASLSLGQPALPCLLSTLYVSTQSSFQNSQVDHAGYLLMSLSICGSPAPILYLGINIRGNVSN